MSDGYEFPFLRKQKISADAYSFFFRKGRDFQFIPGQYIRMRLNISNPDDRGDSRYFTVAASPTEEHIMITTRIIQSAFKKTLLSLQEGQAISIEGPFGNFTLDQSDTHELVFLAGGIGITPFRSMITYAEHKKLPQHMTLFSSFSKAEDVLFFDEFHEAEKALPHFKYVVTVTKPKESKMASNGLTGRIDEEKVKSHLVDVSNSLYYVVGPTKMVGALTDLLKHMQVDQSHIKTENFPGY